MKSQWYMQPGAPDHVLSRRDLPFMVLLALALAVVTGPMLWAAEPLSKPVAKASREKVARIHFGSLFVTCMPVLLPGGGTYRLPGAASAQPVGKSEILLPMLSTVETGPAEEARLRVGETSRLVLLPNGKLTIRPWQMVLDRGSVLLSHGACAVPLRVMAGSGTLVLAPEGLVAVAQQDGGLSFLLQKGTAWLPDLKQTVMADGGSRLLTRTSLRELPAGVLPPGFPQSDSVGAGASSSSPSPSSPFPVNVWDDLLPAWNDDLREVLTPQLEDSYRESITPASAPRRGVRGVLGGHSIRGGGE